MKTFEMNTMGRRLAGFLLVLMATLGAQAEPPSPKLPGRNPDSKEPWGTFLGRAAHDTLGNQYRVQNAFNSVFLNNSNLTSIMKEGGLGDPKRLSEFVRLLRPDITDTTALVLFEIKPDVEGALREGREQAERYLAALNAAVDPGKKLSKGTGFEGSLFLEFENGGALWRLSWRTPEPGVTLYRWSYRREKPNASWKERVNQKEEPLPATEIAQHGELAEQVLRAVYDGSAIPPSFKGQVWLPVDCQ